MHIVRKMTRLCVFSLFMLGLSAQCSAAAVFGVVSSIWAATSDGGFLVFLEDSDVFADCFLGGGFVGIEVDGSNIDHAKNMFALALSAQSKGTSVMLILDDAESCLILGLSS